MTPLGSLFILALIGYGIYYLLMKRRESRNESVEPGGTKLADWNREWEPPEKGAFYRWDEERQAFVEPQRYNPDLPPTHGYYGNVEMVSKYSPIRGDWVRYVEYEGKRYSIPEFQKLCQVRRWHDEWKGTRK